ncbi:MAG: lipopolysaccharide ABC transporter ATP-binding protein, partial [Elusimicrobia bacterium]|nr:lipopolysaccharide ABC transporter ATP-binding protein [Elusimicrobiota bacterium]
HNVRETLPIIDRAYLIYDGRIIVDGTAKHLIQDKQARDLYLGKDFKI